MKIGSSERGLNKYIVTKKKYGIESTAMLHLSQQPRLKDTTSPFIVIKHPGQLFDADRVNEMVMLGAIAVDSVKHGKRDTLYIKGARFLWVEDRSKIRKQYH